MLRDKTTVTVALYNDTTTTIKAWCKQNDITFNQIMRQMTDEWKNANVKELQIIQPQHNKQHAEQHKNFCIKCQQPVDIRFSYELCKECYTKKSVTK